MREKKSEDVIGLEDRLNRYAAEKEHMQWKAEELNRLRNVAVSLEGPSQMGVKGSGSGSRTELMAVRIADTQAELEQARRDAVRTYLEIWDMIGTLPGNDEKQLMICCYLDGDPLPLAAKKLGVSYSKAYDLKRSAY